MKRKIIFRSLALMALAFFLFALTALAEPTSDPTTEPTAEPTIAPTPAPVDAIAASISNIIYTLAPGESFTLSVARFYPSNMDEPLLWKTSRSDITEIIGTDSRDITVKALKNGSATISLMGARSLKVLAKCQVKVRTVKISSMAISPKTLTIAPGRNSELSIGGKPSSATYKTVRWVSSNPELLSFSSAGAVGTIEVNRGERVTVYARAESLTKVTLSATAVSATGLDLKTAYGSVTVRNLSVTKVTLPKAKTIYLEDPNTATWKLTASLTPSLVGEELWDAVTYTSSKEDVAAIDPSTGVLTPMKTGTTYVTASVDGKTSNRCKVTVASKAIKSLSISTPDSKAVVLDPNGTAQLTAIANPSYASNRNAEWNSDKSEVAEVDPNTGLVTAKAGGVATITCSSLANPRVKASIKVHVRTDSDDTVMRTVTISAAGDAVLGGDPRTKGARNPRSDSEFAAAIWKNGGDGKVFTNVAPYFAGPNNIATLNLEGTLTTKRNYSGSKPFVFRGKPEYAKTMLQDNGIDTVCIANNHTYDVGKEGYDGTIRALKGKVGYYGNGITNTIRSLNGLRVSFLGFVAKETSASSVIRQVKAAAKRSDMVVAAFHWTGVSEFRYAAPNSRQKSLARAAINAGADLVLGHHTHRLNGIERYKGKYIVYDLGNFVTIARNPLNEFLPNNPQGRYDYDSMIYQQEFNIWADGFVEAGKITIIPCAITSDYMNLTNNCQPTPYVNPSDKQRVLDTVKKNSTSGIEINVPGL